MNLSKRIYKSLALSRWDNPPRVSIDRFVGAVAREVPKGALILDAGAGECIYSRAFAHCRYISCDMGIGDPNWNYASLNVVSDLTALPFQNNIFDAILCTQTLEHISDPLVTVQGMAALLKPGGQLYLTAPFLGDPLHQEPYDFYRYTKYGLTEILTRSGLSLRSIKPMGGIGFLVCCFLYFVATYVLRQPETVPMRPSISGMTKKISRPLVLFAARFGTKCFANKEAKGHVSEKFTYGYVVVAEKPYPVT